jgi:hypothetical protein
LLLQELKRHRLERTRPTNGAPHFLAGRQRVAEMVGERKPSTQLGGYGSAIGWNFNKRAVWRDDDIAPFKPKPLPANDKPDQ